MFKNKKIAQLERQLDDTLNIYHSTLVQWTKTVDKLKDIERENAKLRAELIEAEEEHEKLFEELIELKRKYTSEVEKNYRFVERSRGEVCEDIKSV